jgi:hypothetical protein
MKLITLLAVLALSGCAHWDELEPAEKVAVGVGATVVVGALIIRNGQGQSQSQCISTRSLETGCP